MLWSSLPPAMFCSLFFVHACLMSLNTFNVFTSPAPPIKSMGWNSRTHCMNLVSLSRYSSFNRYSADQTVQGPSQGPT